MKTPFILAAACLFAGCRAPSVKQALSSMEGESYRRKAEATDFEVDLRYLPRAYRTLSVASMDSSLKLDDRRVDSLRAGTEHQQGLAFYLTIGPKGGGEGMDLSKDLIYSGRSGHEGFSAAFSDFALGMKERIWIEADGKRYPMVTYQMENTWGMSPKRSFLLLFPSLPETAGSRLEVVLEDLVPGLGRKKFQWALPVGKYDEFI